MSVEWKVPSLEVATQNYPTLGAREKNERRIHEWHKLSPTQFCMNSHLLYQIQDAANHRKSWACGVGLYLQHKWHSFISQKPSVERTPPLH